MEAQRYPINVRLIGVMHKEKKNKMFMTSVLWSDQNEIIVYRNFQDFKKMHKQMKKAFPPANPLKRSDRIVPRFQDKRMKRSAGRKGPSKSVVCLKFLEKYCNDLLSCDPRVTQSPDLVRFFHPRDQDLQPEFAKNSIVIMPSDDAVGGGGESNRSANVGNVTQPFVTETYRCVAPYETKDTKNKPFKVVLDEKVDVLIKDKAGWWLVENEDKRLAWFPAPYLEKIDDEDDFDQDEVDGIYGTGVLYTAVKSYKATKGDEVSVDIGSVLEVLQKSDNGWWLVRYNGKAGYVPTMYLQPYNNPRVRMAVFQQGLLSSSLNLSHLQAPSTSLAGHSHELSRSHGNLLQIPATHPSTPNQLQLADKQKSRSLDILSEPLLAWPALASSRTSPSTPASNRAPAHTTPTIMVEMDGEVGRRERRLMAVSEGSLGSDSSDSSFSDDLSSSSGSYSLNLSRGHADECLRLSHTPPPMVSDRLSPDSGTGGKLTPSVSDPNLFKMPVSPKVPPRPRAQEILTRCTTVTRNNASKARLSPVQAEILSR